MTLNEPADEFNRCYTQATMHAGLIDLSPWSTLRVNGADRVSFLQNLCTNHVRDLAPSGGCEAFFTDVKGKIVAHAFLLAGAEEILAVLSPGQLERLIPHLDRYIIREAVQLNDATSEIDWTLVVGPQAPAIVDAINGGECTRLSTNWSHLVRQTGGTINIVRCDLPWCGGLLLARARDRGEVLRYALQESGAGYCDDSLWHTIRVESAWPLFGVDFDSTNLPQEVGRDAAAINFRKGCYLGQETIARIDALGHVNKRLATVRIAGDTPPAAGAEMLQGDQAVGHVTSACWSPKLGAPLALAMLRRGANEVGASLSCLGQTAVVLPSPAINKAI